MSEPRGAGFWPRGGLVPAMASALGAAHGAELVYRDVLLTSDPVDLTLLCGEGVRVVKS